MYVFQSEQVIKLRFNFKKPRWYFSPKELNPLDYHVRWNTPKPTNIAELKTALLSIWNDLPQEFTDNCNPVISKETSILCWCSWQTLSTLSLNIETAADIHY